MTRPAYLILTLWLVFATSECAARDAQNPGSIRNAAGIQLLVADENASPTLRVILPGHPESDPAIEVLFPEHLTVRRHGSADVEHLYLFRPGPGGERPAWRRVGRSLEYEMNLPGDVHLLSRATLDDDGVRFHYEVTNRSNVAYDMVWAVTDPRLISIFHDVRLERTYVHHREGLDLLASETPARLTMPLDQWLPARYLVSFKWPVPSQRVDHQSDGITRYNKSRAVDLPFMATVSADRKWVVASFTREAGNVWSNPELTCQHVDPQAALPPRQKAILEIKILVLKGTPADALRKAVQDVGSNASPVM